MYAFIQCEEKKKKHLSESFWKKVLCFFSPCRRENLFVTEESKESVRKNSSVMDGKAQAITDNIPDTKTIEDITHTCTHSIYAHTFKTLAMWDNPQLLSFWKSRHIPVKIHLRLPIWHTDKHNVQKVHTQSLTHPITHTHTHTYPLPPINWLPRANTDEAQLGPMHLWCAHTKAGCLIFPGSITHTYKWEHARQSGSQTIGFPRCSWAAEGRGCNAKRQIQVIHSLPGWI